MSNTTAFTRRSLPRCVAIPLLLGSLVACGGGGGSLGVGVGVVAPAPQTAVAPLTLFLTRVGPEAIEVGWSDDPYVASFLVLRDGSALASVTTTTLVDASVFTNGTYCYQVQGYDVTGLLVAASSTGCITIFP